MLRVEFPVVAGCPEWSREEAWQDGIPVYARGGCREEGVRDQQSINRRLESAVSWESRV